MKKLMYSVLAVSAIFLSGCNSAKTVVGTVRPAIAPDQVKIYVQAPKKYEVIAIVEASSKGAFAFGDQMKNDIMIGRLKEEAAAVGANGLWLSSTGQEDVSATFMPNNASMYSSGSFIVNKAKTGKGTAIFVFEE